MLKKAEGFIAIFLVVIMFSYACSKEGDFKEIPLNKKSINTSRIMGFGIGSSRRADIGKQKARNSARGNLLAQAMGSDFIYENENNSVSFSIKSQGVLTNVKEENIYDIGDNRYLSIQSIPVPKLELDKKNSYLLETEFRTNNLEKALTEKYKIAVEEIILTNYKHKTNLTGKLFLTGITLSDYKNTLEMTVKIKVLILVSQTK